MAKKPCARPGCSNTVERGFCAQHQAQSPAASYERARGSASSRGYGRGWAEYSRERLKRFPVCADPYDRHKGRSELAECTDHIESAQARPDLFWEESNHQSLCIGCNSYKAALLEGGFGRGGGRGVQISPGGGA